MNNSKFNYGWLLIGAILVAATFLSFNKPTIIEMGADRQDQYLDALKGKKIGVVANQTTIRTSEGKHLVDFLVENAVEVSAVFAPEHGFRGNHSAGAKVDNEVDEKTGIPLISLYGSHKKPTKEDLHNVEVLIFDIQDVGARFYTYISTMHYVMEAAAEHSIPVIVLDRPNPHGHYFDGPVLKESHKSFVGMHPVPVVHGMTIGEYACMINGEGWLANEVRCELTIVEMKGWNRGTDYRLPIAPSPNLPNQRSIELYPSLCFFEGTTVSVGRGTSHPFQVYGHPNFEEEFSFTPKKIPGVSDYPKHENAECFGMDLRSNEGRPNQLNLSHLIAAFENEGIPKTDFFTSFFNKLAGNSDLMAKIIEGQSEEQIRDSWQGELETYAKVREKYLLYP